MISNMETKRIEYPNDDFYSDWQLCEIDIFEINNEKTGKLCEEKVTEITWITYETWRNEAWQCQLI